MLLLIDLGKSLLIVNILSGHLSDCLLLLLTPKNHRIFELKGFLICALRGLKTLVHSVLVSFVLIIQLRYVRFELTVHV